MVMYADDTTLFCNIDNNVTEDVINRELFKIYEWLGANKLALNVSKTKFMVFHTRNKSVKYPSLLINGILYRLKIIYPQLVLQTLYNTLILPYFNYCIVV